MLSKNNFEAFVMKELTTNVCLLICQIKLQSLPKKTFYNYKSIVVSSSKTLCLICQSFVKFFHKYIY